MNVIMAIVIVVSIVVFVIGDHLRFWSQTSKFTKRANELGIMYNYVLKFLNDKDDDTEFLEYEGLYYTVKVNKGDYKSFVKQIQAVVKDIMGIYEAIDPRYFEQMDDETAEELELFHSDIQKIDYAVRMVIWQNGWK